ncbi:MAG TPA: alpha/beta hydrolase [Terracidiphilus sp.]|jgi:esterase|nr:alpha/beta hydrolase [Terracidiphilus sp.]
MNLERHTFQHAGLTFSYLDSRIGDQTLIALHAHLMEAATFAPLAAALAPDWRVVALDQRGHGYTDHAPSYTRADYIADLEALFAHLHLPRAVLLGNSLGGVNAFQFAALHPEQVTALIIEDIGATVSDDIRFILAWAGTFATREALAAKVGERFALYIADSFRHTRDGWRLAFEPAEMLDSQNQLIGDHWHNWLATTGPALLVRGRQSRVTNPDEMEQMARRRPNTTLVTLDGGHVLHIEDPFAFNATVRGFLDSL